MEKLVPCINIHTKGGLSVTITWVKKRKLSAWRAFFQVQRQQEKKFKAVMDKFFKEQTNRIVKKFGGKDVSYTSIEIKAQIDRLVDWEEEDEALEKALMPIWTATAIAGYKLSSETYGFQIDFDLFRSEATDGIKTWGAEKVTNINRTTKEKLQKVIAQNLEDGLSIPEMGANIAAQMDIEAGYRAQMIARTESTGTMNFGSVQTYKQAGVKTHQWLTAQDDRVRDQHAAINGEEVKVGEPFSNGLEFPGDPWGDAAEVINCRCTLVPIIE